MTSISTYRSRAALLATALVFGAGLIFTSAGGAAVVKRSSRGLTATMKVGTHHPVVGRKWHMTFTAKRGGRAARVTVTYEYLYAGKVVAVRAHHTFTGRYEDALVFPATALHQPLTFRAVVSAGRTKINLDYPIEVER